MTYQKSKGCKKMEIQAYLKNKQEYTSNNLIPENYKKNKWRPKSVEGKKQKKVIVELNRDKNRKDE